MFLGKMNEGTTGRLPGETEHTHFTVYIYKEDISKVCC